jgi:hypothetical protein
MHELLAVATVVSILGCGGQPKPVLVARSSPAALPPPPAACRGNALLDGNGNLIVAGTWRDRPVRILVDTGANGGSVSAEIVAEAALPATGKAKYASATGLFLDTTVHDAGELTIGGATLSANHFIATATHGGEYDFAIGLDQLAAHAVVVDLARKSFCLAASPHELATLPMRVAGGEENRDIVVSATFGERRLDNMILDTGAGVTCVNQGLMASIAHTELPERAQAIDGTGQVVELPLVTVPAMCVHDQCVSDHMVMPTEDLSSLVGHPVDGIVGLPFFEGHPLVLDFPASKIGIL